MYGVVIIKRIALISAVTLMLIFLGGCADEPLTDIDSFIAAYNEISQSEISKTDFCGFADSGKISHCFMIGDTLISLNTDEESMKIESADAVTEEKPDEEYKNAVRLMLQSLTTLSDNDIYDTVEKMIPTSSGFIRTSTEDHEYSLSFVSVDAGSKFTLGFNRLVPTETTKIPVTQQEFKEFSTIPDFTE